MPLQSRSVSLLGSSGAIGSLLQLSLKPSPLPLLRQPWRRLRISQEGGPAAEFEGVEPSLAPSSSLIVLICKSYDVMSAVSTLPTSAPILILSNGLVPLIQPLQECRREGELFMGSTTVGAGKLSDVGGDDGLRAIEVKENGRGQTILGSVSGGKDGKVDSVELLELFQSQMNAASFPTSVVERSALLRALWMKMFLNCLINPGCTINGTMNEEAQLDTQLLNECLSVQRVVSPQLTIDQDEVKFVFDEVVEKTGKNRNSMLQDLEAGRKTEIDFLTGYIRRVGEEHGVDVRRSRELEVRVKDLERVKNTVGT